MAGARGSGGSLGLGQDLFAFVSSIRAVSPVKTLR
jgi:hypothetical protein